MNSFDVHNVDGENAPYYGARIRDILQCLKFGQGGLGYLIPFFGATIDIKYTYLDNGLYQGDRGVWGTSSILE